MSNNNDWEIVKVDNDTDALADLACFVATGGLSIFFGGCGYTTTYTIRNKDGVEKEVIANSEDEVRKRIAKGEFG